MDLIRRRAFLIGSQRVVPPGFRAVDFIQSTGRQYINTGYIASNNTKSIVRVDYVSGNGNSFIYGGARSYNNRSYECYPWDNDMQFGYGTSINYVRDIISKSGQIVTIKRQGKAIELVWEDGTIMSGENVDSVEFDSQLPVALFALNRYSGISYPTTGNKCFSAQFYDGDTLVRNFIPCVREADDKPGMYDLCGSIYSETNSPFYTNAGTGEFVVSP